MQNCNSFSFAVGAFISDFTARCEEALTEVEDMALEKLAQEIAEKSESQEKWRVEAISLLKEVEKNAVGDAIEIVFGADLGSISGDMKNRVIVALFGNQHSGNIRSKPGASVYGKTMTGKHESTADSSYPIPQFDHPQNYDGTKMLENTIKRTRRDFDKAIASLLRGFNFAEYVIVSGG